MSKRELNMATSKKKILAALLEEINSKEFESIKISGLCKKAEVSPASFYNYFPQKIDILVYYIQLWAVEMYWRTSVDKQLHGLDAIRHVFEQTASLCASHSNLFSEIISFQVKVKKMVNQHTLTQSDKLVFFPNLPGIEAVTVQDLKDILLVYLKQAIDNKELPDATDATVLLTALSGIFFTVPILFNHCSETAIKEAFNNQLNLIMYGAVGHCD